MNVTIYKAPKGQIRKLGLSSGDHDILATLSRVRGVRACWVDWIPGFPQTAWLRANTGDKEGVYVSTLPRARAVYDLRGADAMEDHLISSLLGWI